MRRIGTSLAAILVASAAGTDEKFLLRRSRPEPPQPKAAKRSLLKESRYSGLDLMMIRAGVHPGDPERGILTGGQARECARRLARGCVQ